MMDFLVTADGGLTTAGYVTSIAAMVILVVIAAVLFHKKSSSGKLTTQQLVTCAVALALAYATSYLKVFSLPFGGSVTLCSMLFIVLIGYWYGPKIGILTGLVYGIFQFLQEPYVLSFFPKSKKYGLQKAYVAAILARGVFHVLGGYLYWMSYMPENYPKSLSAIYPIVYNYSYILAEGVITLILISIPAVSKALVQVRKMVTVPGEQNA